jgi:hypothetical protein
MLRTLLTLTLVATLLGCGDPVLPGPGTGHDPDPVPGGPVRCRSTEGASADATCSDTWKECADGSVYVLACQSSAGGWSCTCSKDGEVQKTLEDPDYCDLGDAREAASLVLCGWDLY